MNPRKAIPVRGNGTPGVMWSDPSEQQWNTWDEGKPPEWMWIRHKDDTKQPQQKAVQHLRQHKATQLSGSLIYGAMKIISSEQ